MEEESTRKYNKFRGKKLYDYIYHFLEKYKYIFSNSNLYDKMLYYFKSSDNIVNRPFNYTGNNNLDVDISLIVNKTQLEKGKKYSYIRYYYRQVILDELPILWKGEEKYKNIKNKLKSKNEGKHFLYISLEKIESELIEIYKLYDEYIYNNIINIETKNHWKELKENFNVIVFYNLLNDNPYILQSQYISLDVIDYVKNRYNDYIQIKRIILEMNDDYTSGNKEDAIFIEENIPKYFFNFGEDQGKQDSIMTNLEINNFEIDNISIFENIFNELTKTNIMDEDIQIFYNYFLEHKSTIIKVIDDLLDKYNNIKNNTNITDVDKKIINYINKNYNDVINGNQDSRIYIFFMSLKNYSLQIKHIFSLSPIKSIVLSHNNVDENKGVESKQKMIHFQVNGITDQREFLEKIYVNIEKLIEKLIEKTGINVNTIKQENELIYKIRLYKINTYNGKKWWIHISLHSNTIEKIKEELKMKFIKLLFDMIIVINYYRTILNTVLELWDFMLDTVNFGIGYIIKPFGQGYQFKDNNCITVEVKENENPFNEEGYIYNPPNDDNKCFIYCMKWLGYTNIESDLNDLCIDYSKGISFNSIKFLSQEKNIYIELYDETTDKIYCYGKIQDNVYKIIYENGHYLCFSKYNHKTTKQYRKKFPMLFVFFDIETLTHKNTNILYPLSNKYIIITKSELKDFNWDTKKDIYLNKSIFDFNPLYIDNIGENPLLPMIKNIIDLSYKHKIKLIGYNSSGFDLFFVMDELKDYIEQVKIRKSILPFIVKNRIYNLRYNNISSFDIYLHLKMSLFDSCNSFNTNPKKDKDIGEWVLKELQHSYINNNLINSFKKYKNDLDKYNTYDIMCLISLLQLYNQLIRKLEPFKYTNVWKHPTLPSMINHYFQHKVYPENCYNIVKPYTRKDYLTFKKYQTGGIVGIFGNNSYSKYGEDVYLYDIISQYPYVCLTYNFPCGDYYYTPEFDKDCFPNLDDKLGIYWCKINCNNLYLPIVPPKNDNKTNNWSSSKNELYECSLTTPEINYLLSNNCYVEVLSGFTFESKCNPFKEYMEPISIEKVILDKKRISNTMSDSDKIIRNLYKLILNGSTGSVNQKLHEIETILKDDGYIDLVNLKFKNIDDKLDKLYQNKKVSRPYLGTYIYSYSRLMICQIVNSIEQQNKLYCRINKLPFNNVILYGDTDSLLITQRGKEIWENDKNLNNKLLVINDNREGEFGYFKCEGFFNYYILIDKKIYTLYNKNDCYPQCRCPIDIVKRGDCLNGNKYRLKGIGLGFDLSNNGYVCIPFRSNIHIVDKNINNVLYKECKDNVCNQLSNMYGIKVNITNKQKLLYTFEKYYYKQMKLLENKYYDNNNKIRNMRNLNIYYYLLSSRQLKFVKYNTLHRRIKKNYKITQVDTQVIFSPNTIQYHQLKHRFIINKHIKKLSKCLIKLSKSLNKLF
jgi:hypothetical protein